MNWRLKFLSVFIIGVFAAFSIYYYKYFISPKPSGVILFVVPGLSLENLAKTDDQLNLAYRSKRVAIINNNDLNPYKAQPNSILSYLSTGNKSRPDRIGLSTNGLVQDTLLYTAQRAGRTIGIITTENLTSIEAAAFYAHSKAPDNTDDLLQQLFDNTKINLILGGGNEDFTRVETNTKRDLQHEAELNGYKVIHTDDELQDIAAWRTRRLLGVFADKGLPFYDPLADESGHNPYPTLVGMVRKSIQCLELNLNGYFLVVHNGLIAKAIQKGDSQQVITEIKQLDQALHEARTFAGKNSVIILYCPYNVSAGSVPNAENFADLTLGWLSIYSESSEDSIKGFATGKDLYRFINRQF